MLVAIALLGLIAGIGVVSLRTDAPSRDSATARAQRLAARLATARNEAIRSGQAVTIYVDDRPRDAQPHGDAVNGVLVATAQPDGSLLLDEAFAAAVAVGRLDGEVRPEADRARR
ncbi:MAG TPA: GspH/FimT family pseudopilin [Gemmatimonadaceae bacterium]|nr:GspH/FimT family pseudopilin [Gemmatimonadaceae bacterium]